MQQRKGGRASLKGQVDAKVTYSAGPEEVWTFEHRRLYLNGHDFAEYLDPKKTDALSWCQLLDSLQEYAHWAFAHGVPTYPKIAKAVAHYRNQLQRSVHKDFHERMGGVRLTWGEGEVLINNLNVRALLTMYQVRPTAKARCFLEGLRTKLALLLCQGPNNPEISRATNVVQGLYDEICTSLARETIDTHCLPTGSEPLTQ
jgi:hypothetical protein